MKSTAAGLTCLVFCIFVTNVTTQETIKPAIQQLAEHLQSVTTKNETANTEIKNQIRVLLKKIDSTASEDDTSLDNSRRVLKKIELCRKGLLYIKDNLTITEMDEECEQCVKEPDTTELTELFDDLGPEIWDKIDSVISELLVDAAASLKGLKNVAKADAYRKKLYCNAERMNLSSNEMPDDDPVDLHDLLTSITNGLDLVTPKNQTINHGISQTISNSLKTLDPIICEDAFVPSDYGRTLKKVLLCKKALIYLRDNVKRSDEGAMDCRNCVKNPDTRPLLFLLYDFAPEIAGRMNDFIGNFLVDAAVSLKSLPDGEKYGEYRKQLDFNINRLNLIW